MKFASFNAAGMDRVGVALGEEHLIDLVEAATAAGIDAAGTAPLGDMVRLIEAAEAGSDAVRRAVAHAIAHPREVRRHRIDQVRWHAPVRRPSKIVCLALNNSANTDRIISGPKHPAAFIKGANALAGHREPIVIRPAYGRCHPEPELALVMGRHASEVHLERAYDYVFGYTIHNDITSPSMRAEDTFHYRAIHPAQDDPSRIEYVDTWTTYPGRYKGSDTFSPMGPWLVTRDEIANPHDLAISCRHKDELVTEDNTGNLFYKIPEVLAFLSQFMTFLPGDILSLGTAIKRSGPGTRPVQSVDLAGSGGPVAVSIAGLGTLTNPVEIRTR
jgi:2-keto-4-pentenoate hydratase/2-oxohepta-3-ene-1,7-dioic acid hydratase in catechol pathway